MKVFVSSCSMKPEYTSILWTLRMLDYADGQGIKCELRPRLDESLICRARNRALGDFFYGDWDYLMSIDDDLLFPEDTIVKLVNVDKDIVGGLYRLKTAEYLGIAQRVSGADDWRPLVDSQEVVSADYAATGCMLVKRDVIVSMINHFPELVYSENLSGQPLWALYQPMVFNNGEFMEYLSEDWAFCERARQAGHSIYLHGGVQGQHWGKYLFSLETVEDG